MRKSSAPVRSCGMSARSPVLPAERCLTAPLAHFSPAREKWQTSAFGPVLRAPGVPSFVNPFSMSCSIAP